MDKAKSQKPKPNVPPARTVTFLADVWPNELGLVKALRNRNITEVSHLEHLKDAEILAIPGIQETRFRKILKLIGRESEEQQARRKRLEALKHG